MRTASFLLILLTGLNLNAQGQNILRCNGAFARPGDTITVAFDIDNADPFISFQFDLTLPENVSYLESSIHLSQRSVNHVALGNLPEPHRLRIFSYSPNNTAFSGSSGEIVTLRLVVGDVRGEFVMSPQNGIIGDSLSQNILTETEAGILSVFPAGVPHPASGRDPFSGTLSLFPNPVKTTALLRFRLTSPCTLALDLFNLNGQQVHTAPLGAFVPGTHEVEISKWLNDLPSGSTCFLRLSSSGTPGGSAIQSFLKE